MPRKLKVIPGPSKLSIILKQLSASPKPTLSELQALHLKLAAKNDHFGARHFLKEDLPRIRYANPTLKISIDKLKKGKEDAQWKPEMFLEFRNGRKETLDLSQKWSTDIFDELMDTAGGAAWAKQKHDHPRTEGQLTGSVAQNGAEKTLLSRAASTPPSSTL